METKEKNFENDIEARLLAQGYRKGSMATYDKQRAIDMPVLVEFIQNTQPKMWQRYVNVYGEKAEKQLYTIFQQNVEANGLIWVLRNGVKDRGMDLRFAYFAPASNLNLDLVERYKGNILTCTRQFAYSNENNNTIDIVLSLNGIPVVALELKNQLTGQSVSNAKRQFMYDRNPKELCFRFNQRFLVYFAVDLYEVAMATELKGVNTYFLPFNQGSNGAGNIGDGGNPQPSDGSYATSYLWERVLSPDMLLSIFQRYISKQVDETMVLEKGVKKKKKSVKLIFPRYHQLDVVEKVIADTKRTTEGRNYLLQHSAGSGKSNEIAWLAYRLASLHNEEDKEMFQSVFVITDRRVLNRQLQDTILGFDHYEGMIATITDKDNSSLLKQAIEDKKRIIITTLFKFSNIYRELDSHKGKKFAVIVDEAHSSQSGNAATHLRAALADTDEALREWAEIEGKSEDELVDEMENLSDLLTQGQHKNQYFYAFTATPKPKTLRTFGEWDGAKYNAFHHYSMRQAIDEGFILDVLKYYTTIETSYQVAKTISDNPEFEEPPATKAVKAFHDNHEFVIEQMVALMVEKIREVTLNKIGGKAKAMVVSPSRAHAVRFFLAMKEYCKKQGYKNVKPMVAFSGSVSYNGQEFTESQLNSTEELKISESALPIYFASEMFNVLIVADKYQTGFDEPLLHTMFVAKRLKGVKAVQTLSRLNRSCRGKVDTYVLDFSNTADSIKASFEPFFEDTWLGDEIDVNIVYKYLNEIKSYHLWSADLEQKVFETYTTTQEMGKLTALYLPVLEDYEALDLEDKFKVRSIIRNFNRFYSYMAQIVRTFDVELYKTYIFTEILYKLIPKTPHEKVDLSGKLALEQHKFSEGFSGSIVLAPTVEVKTLESEKGGSGNAPEEKRDLLGNIIEKINLMYQGNFTEADRVIVETIYDAIQKEGKKLSKQAKNSDVNMFAQNIFPKVFEKIAQDCYVQQMDSFAKLFEEPSFYKRVMEEMARAMYFNLKNGE
jgi:type I restriction enzyme R subunit